MSSWPGDHVEERNGLPNPKGMAGGAGTRGVGRRGAVCAGHGAGLPRADGAARTGRPRAAEHYRAGPGAGHRRLRAGRRGAGPPAAGPVRPRSPGQGAGTRPLQAVVLGTDEQDSPYHETLRSADDIAAMPVVVADLHSALAPVLAGLYHDAERAAGDRSPAGDADGPERPQRASRACRVHLLSGEASWS